MSSANVKNNPLFDEDVKNEFLNTIKEGTRQSYKRIFTITSKFEYALDKDLNKFTLNEMETILFSFKSSSRNTIETYGRIISSYLNWSVENDLIHENVLKDLNPNDFEKYMVDDLNYITNKEMIRLENLCENYQDSVILRLLFIGVGGRESSEIRNLKISDVDFEGKHLTLINTLKYDENGYPLKFTKRIINVDDHTLKLIKGAFSQKTYMKRNGDIAQTPNENVRPYTDLVSNDYIVRPSITKTDGWNAPIDKFGIYRRLKMLSEVLGVSPLNVKHIQKSGMLYYASILTNNGESEISLEDFKMIASKFNMKSYHNLKGFVTDETIIKLYSNS